MPLKVLIAGGGIAGLTTALACLKAGFTVHVFERASELSEIGAGIQIGPNAARVMHALGLETALGEVGSFPALQEMRLGRSNTNIFRSPLGDAAIEKYGAPYYLLHRADLITILGETLEARSPGALMLGKTVSSYENNPSGATLVFEDGSKAHGDVVIAADGIHSTLRAAMMGAEEPRFTGNIVWRAMIPASDRLRKLIPDSMCIWVGPEKHCVTYWLRGGQMINFVGAVERDDWTEESWNSAGEKADFAADFRGWSAPITAAVEESRQCSRWALFDRDPQPRWVDGNVVLVGDACHPMLPFLAQGAAMAIEDAWVLVAMLEDMPSDIPAALKRYEDLRLPRTAKVQSAARARMHSNHHRSGYRQLKEYVPMWLSSRLTPRTFEKRYQWLFAKNVIAESRRLHWIGDSDDSLFR